MPSSKFFGLLVISAAWLYAGRSNAQTKSPTTVLPATQAQVPPQFPGGDAALARYLTDSLRYPGGAYQQRIQGRVTVQLVVAADGQVQQVQAEPLGGGCQAEAVRLVQSMPRWTPAQQQGRVVATRTSVAVEFRAENLRRQAARLSQLSALPRLTIGREQTEAASGSVELPTFFGAPEGETDFLRQMPVYVAYAKERNISGIVQLGYTVEADGRVAQVRVLRSLCPPCDAEVQRVARAQPRWYAGTRAGKPVAMAVVQNVLYEPDYGTSLALPAAFGSTVQAPDVPAAFPGGVAALAKALHTVRLPEDVPGMLDTRPPFWVSFTVEADGRLTNIKSLDEPENNLTDEARLVVAALPRWQPARRQGKAVASAQVLGVSHAAVAYYEQRREAKAAQAGVPVEYPKDTRLYDYTELMPEFAGGMAGIQQYLQQHTKLPAEVVQGKVEGKVFVQMVVQPDGSLREVQVQKGLSPACDAEALRLIKAMPRWTPGQQNGQKVAVRYTIPVPFAKPAAAGK